MALMVATCLLGAAFLVIEVHEFVGMVARGAGPTRSAFLSAFFYAGPAPWLARDCWLTKLLTMSASGRQGDRADILRLRLL